MTTEAELIEEHEIRKAQKRVELGSQVFKAIPSNWCDPLLTGPEKVLPDGYVYNPKDIENLLNAIRSRMEKIFGI